MTINARFASVWNGGEYLVTTGCKVNLETKEVFDIEVNESDNIEALNSLDGEYIELESGEAFDVFAVDEKEDGDYWYE